MNTVINVMPHRPWQVYVTLYGADQTWVTNCYSYETEAEAQAFAEAIKIYADEIPYIVVCNENDPTPNWIQEPRQ